MNYIYVIENTVNGKLYIGRTRDAKQRKYSHFYKLRAGSHPNPKLQNSFNKYGEGAFTFTVVDEAPEESIEQKEYEWFEKYSFDKNKLFNCHFQTSGGPVADDLNHDHVLSALTERYETRTGFRELAEKHKISTETLLKYIPFWEKTTGLTMFSSTQTLAAKDRVAKFVEAFQVIGVEAMRNYKDYGVSFKTLQKYLPEFGLAMQDVHADTWREEGKQKALEAIRIYKETGCSAQSAIRQAGSCTTSFYKYLKE